MLGLAAAQILGRLRAGDEVHTPGWLAKLDTLSPPACFGAGALLSFANLKNIVLIPSAAVTIARADLDTSGVLVASLVFAVVATLGLATPLTVSLVAGDRAAAPLARMRGWLTQYSYVILAVLFLILGWNMLGKGIGGLFG